MGDLQLNGKEFNFDPNKNITKDELANKNGINVDKLETLFTQFDDIKLVNGLSAKEAQNVINLFDANSDKKITNDEVSDAKIKEFIAQNGGNANDASLLEGMKSLLSAISNTFGKDNGGFYNITDANGNVTEKYTLETNNGVTKKTHYSTDGTKNNRIAEQWEAGFKNYKKEWTGPNGERTVLEGTAVKDNGDGTYTLTVKRTDSRYEDAYFEMVFDSNGQELSRTDASGNKYTSNGAPLNGVDNNVPAGENNGGEEKSVVVEKWGKGVTNSTLSGIITSAYGVKYGTDEYFAIEKMVMDANPDIYGDADGNGGRTRILDGTRHNAVIHAGDTIKLPPYDGKTADPAKGGDRTPATGGGTPAGGAGRTAPTPSTGGDTPADGRTTTETREDGSKVVTEYKVVDGQKIKTTETITAPNGNITKITYADDGKTPAKKVETTNSGKVTEEFRYVDTRDIYIREKRTENDGDQRTIYEYENDGTSYKKTTKQTRTGAAGYVTNNVVYNSDVRWLTDSANIGREKSTIITKIENGYRGQTFTLDDLDYAFMRYYKDNNGQFGFTVANEIRWLDDTKKAAYRASLMNLLQRSNNAEIEEFKKHWSGVLQAVGINPDDFKK